MDEVHNKLLDAGFDGVEHGIYSYVSIRFGRKLQVPLWARVRRPPNYWKSANQESAQDFEVEVYGPLENVLPLLFPVPRDVTFEQAKEKLAEAGFVSIKRFSDLEVVWKRGDGRDYLRVYLNPPIYEGHTSIFDVEIRGTPEAVLPLLSTKKRGGRAWLSNRRP